MRINKRGEKGTLYPELISNVFLNVCPSADATKQAYEV